MTSNIISNTLFTSLPQVSTYPNIATLIASQTPLAPLLNGMKYMKQILSQINEQSGDKKGTTAQFYQITKFYNFDLYKASKPNIIFAHYYGRVFPDNNGSSTQISQGYYAPEMQFKIDFDSCVVTEPIAYISQHIENSWRSANSLNINGFSAKGLKDGLEVPGNKVQSFQYAYGPDFIYHYVSQVDLGFCNTGGSNTIWHQKVPSEIIWIYNNIIQPQEYGDEVRRLLRDDIFTIGHDPFHIYGDFVFEQKADNDLNSQYDDSSLAGSKQFKKKSIEDNHGFNEIGMYHNSARLEGLNLSNTYKSYFANTNNTIITDKLQSSEYQIINNEHNENTEYPIYQIIGYNQQNSICYKNNLTLQLKRHINAHTAETPQGIISYNVDALNSEYDSDFQDYTINLKDQYLMQVVVTSIQDLKSYIQTLTYTDLQKYKSFKNVKFNQIKCDVDNSTLQPLDDTLQIQVFVIPVMITKYDNSSNTVSIYNTLLFINTSQTTMKTIIGYKINAYYLDESNIKSSSKQQKVYDYQNVTPTSQYLQFGKVDTVITANDLVIDEEDDIVEGDNNNTNTGIQDLTLLKSYQAQFKLNDSNRYASMQIAFGLKYTTYNYVTQNTPIQTETSIKDNIGEYSYLGTTEPQDWIQYIQLSTDDQLITNIKNLGSTQNDNDIIDYTLLVQEQDSNLLDSIITSIISSFNLASPYSNISKVNYGIVQVNPIDENDYGFDALYKYMSTNTFQNVTDQIGIQSLYRYNMAILNNKQNEEFNPTLNNPDYISIHTYRKSHGFIDFYFPLNFLFISQGIHTGFPHYACASQNPRAFINTMVAVDPKAIDELDSTNESRIFINRVNQYKWLTTNTNDMRMILFYTRLVWIPELAGAIINNNKYVWITKNYERTIVSINTNSNNQQQLQTFNRSVFYTKIWMFIVNYDTYNTLINNGGSNELCPVYVNKFDLKMFDVMNYKIGLSQYGQTMEGSDKDETLKNANDPQQLTPVDSFQLLTDSTINMQDQLPARLQQHVDWISLEHTQRHQPIRCNNLYQFNIDSKFYQEGTPNTTYSPAYSPKFKLVYTPKSNTTYYQYGVIIISECINISYIANHIMLCKYQTDN